MSAKGVNGVIKRMLNDNLWNLIDFGPMKGDAKSDSDQIISLDSDEETRDYDYDGNFNKVKKYQIEEVSNTESSSNQQKSARTSPFKDQAKSSSKESDVQPKRLKGNEEASEHYGTIPSENSAVVIIDERKKGKFNLTDENIHTHPTTGYKYQVYYDGKAIDKASLRLITLKQTFKTDGSWVLCRLHDDCSYSKPNLSLRKRCFNQSSFRHVRNSIAIFLCRLCLHTFCRFDSLKAHLRRHLAKPVEKKNQISSSWVQTIGHYPDSTLMDYQGTHKLNITDEKILSHPKTNYEYQIYYEGRVIDKDELRKNLVEKALKTKPGWFICPVHDDCVYKEAQADPKIQARSQFNQNSLKHYENAFVTYLCKQCYRKYGHLNDILIHAKKHSQKSLD